ncbi:M20/M25/M40 family metallo-hydrolase [Kribbella sp. NBC_00889]|uniref:M20/M25/M40 family metallo-hydrolase n=1 Tax=Kribbella sp. NBC_00889 TaxID=2975974 RepID=UPI00386BB58C|nr:M20/M25/M40 family metallo-hydrolase [Kribbella sp. NBC_00889]
MSARGQAPLADVPAAVDPLLPALVADLLELAAIPSIAFPGHPAEPMVEAHRWIVDALAAAGADQVQDLEVGDAAPTILATFPGSRPDGPVVLLYAHYDVQPPGDGWDTPPFTPTPYESEHGPAIWGRGVADDKVNVIAQLGALQVFDGRPPVTVKVLVDSGEEYGNELEALVLDQPTLFAADVVVIADLGNLRPGTPTLTTALRGSADLLVEVRTLAGSCHSGSYGGAAPDALLTLLQALASLHTPTGDVAVQGLRRESWTDSELTEGEFRKLASVHDDVPLLGTGGLGERLWSGPAITVTALDAPSVADGPAAVQPYARARVNIRVHPAQDPYEAQQLVAQHLERAMPFGIPLKVTREYAGPGFDGSTEGPAYEAAVSALRAAWETDTVSLVANGGSVPLVNALAASGAEVLLFGAQDNGSRQHAANERVVISELRATVIALSTLLTELGHRCDGSTGAVGDDAHLAPPA